MLNNVENFYLSCFVVANAIYNINRFYLQELGNVVVGILLLRIRGLIAGDDGVIMFFFSKNHLIVKCNENAKYCGKFLLKLFRSSKCNI